MFKSILLAAALMTFSVPAAAAGRSGIKVKITAREGEAKRKNIDLSL